MTKRQRDNRIAKCNHNVVKKSARSRTDIWRCCSCPLRFVPNSNAR